MKKKVLLFFLMVIVTFSYATGPKGILIEIEDPAGVNPIASYITFEAWIKNSNGIQESIALDEEANMEPWGYPTSGKYLYIDVGNFENFTPGPDYFTWTITDILHIEVTFNDGSEVFPPEIKEYVLEDSNPVVYFVADGDGIQFGSVQTVTNSYSDDTSRTYEFSFGEPLRENEIIAYVDPTGITTESGDITISQYDRPAHNIPDNSQAVPFGLKIEDRAYTYEGSESFAVTFGWSNDVQNSSFSNPILVYSKDNGKLWTEYTTDISWDLSGTGDYDNQVSFTIGDFTPGYTSTTQNPNPSLWAIGDKTMFNLAKISSISSDISIQTSKYTDGEVTYNFSLTWTEQPKASYYRYRHCTDPGGTYTYTSGTENIEGEEYDFTFANNEQVRYIKIQGYNGIENTSSLSDETIVVRRYQAPLSTTVSGFTYSFLPDAGTITPAEIDNLIGDCNVIAQWSDANQAWSSIGNMPSDNGGWENSSHEFDKAKPFLLNSTNNLKNVFLVKNINMSSYTSPSYTINVGGDSEFLYTLVTVPYNTGQADAAELSVSIWADGSSTADEITVSKLDQFYQVWKAYNYNGSSGSGDNFTIYPGDVIKVGAYKTTENSTTFNWQE